MKGYAIDFPADEKLDLRCSCPWGPPLDHSPVRAECDDGVAFILAHGSVVIFGGVVGDDVAGGGIVVPQSPVIVHGEEEVVGEVLDPEGLGELVELDSFAVVDEGGGRLAERQHLIVVQEGPAGEPLSQV
jgi:hypothetical protein